MCGKASAGQKQTLIVEVAPESGRNDFFAFSDSAIASSHNPAQTERVQKKAPEKY
jgi:hypothetical protein